MLESNKDSAKLDAMKRIVGVGQMVKWWNGEMVKDFDFRKLSRLWLYSPCAKSQGHITLFSVTNADYLFKSVEGT